MDVSAVEKALARETSVRLVSTQEAAQACGLPQGSVRVEISGTDTVGPDEQAALSLLMWVSPDGLAHSGDLTVRWHGPDGDLGFTSVGLDGVRLEAVAATMPALIEQLDLQQRRQEVIDALIAPASRTICVDAEGLGIGFHSRYGSEFARIDLDPDGSYTMWAALEQLRVWVQVPQESLADALDALGRELLIARDEFHLITGADSGRLWLGGVLARVRAA